MKKSIEDIGYFNDSGRWISENPAILANYKAIHKNERTLLKIQKWYPKRTLPENNYMWGVVYQKISEFTGMTPDEVHDVCKLEFNFKFVEVRDKNTGELKTIKVPQSTRDLDTVGMEDYLESIRKYYLIEFGLLIPLPNEVIQD